MSEEIIYKTLWGITIIMYIVAYTFPKDLQVPIVAGFLLIWVILLLIDIYLVFKD
jgi:FtsH-binding integral membrane protein